MQRNAAYYIMRNAGLEEAQAGIKIARRNINNLRYADDTTLMAESEEELKSLLRVKEESEKLGLKLNIQKTKIMASSSITSWQMGGEDPLEKEMVNHSYILAWRIPWMEKPGRLQSTGSQRVGQD